MVGQSEAFVSPLRWLDGDSGAKAGSRRDESHLPVESSPGTSSSVSRGLATTVPLPTLPEHWKEGALLVVLEFLHRHGHSSSALALENETGVHLEELEEDMYLLRSWILHGKFSHCYQYIGSLDQEGETGRGGLDVVGAISECKKAAFFELLTQKEKPTPVNDLVLALEDMEKTCTTECFNEACYCMSLTRLQDHPPYRDWTRDKGRAQCFERVRKCLEYQYNKSPNRGSASSSFAPRLETILRRSRAWLDLVQDRSSASETRFNRSPGDRLSHSPHGSPNTARNRKSFQSSEGSPNPSAGAGGGSTDRFIDLCDKLNEKAEVLTQSNDFGPHVYDKDENEAGFNGGQQRTSTAGGSVGGLREKIRDRSNSKGGHTHGGGSCCLHSHDLPCSPGWIADKKLAKSPEPKKKSPKAARRKRQINSFKSGDKKAQSPPKSPSHASAHTSESPQSSPAADSGGPRRSAARALSPSFSVRDQIAGAVAEAEAFAHAEVSEDVRYGDADISRGFVSREVYRDSHPIRCLSFCDNSSFLALGCNKDKAIRVFQMNGVAGEDGAKGNRLEEIFTRKKHHDGSIYCLEWKKTDGCYLIATGSNDHLVKVLTTFDFRGDSTITLSGHNGTIRDLSMSQNTNLMASGGAGDNGIRLWDVKRQRCVGELYRHEAMVTSVSFSKHRRDAYFSGDKDGVLLSWDARSSEVTSHAKDLRSARTGISSLGVSGGDYLGMGYSDGCFQVLDTRNWKIVFEKFIHSKECRSLDFSPDDKWLLSTSFDCMSHVVSVVDGSVISSSRSHSDKVVQGKWNPLKVQYATCSVDGTVQLYDPRRPLGDIPDYWD